MTVRAKTVFAICFLMLTGVFFSASVVSYLRRHPGLLPHTETVESDVPIVWSFVDQYPFENTEDQVVKCEPPSRFAGKYLKKAAHMQKMTQAYTTHKNPFTPPINRIAEGIDELLRSDFILNGSYPFVKLPNGYFTHPYPYSDPSVMENQLKSFTGWLEDRGIAFLALIPVDKGDDSISVFPEGIPHGYSRMAGEFKSFLKENGICYLDSKEKLLAQNSDFYHWFYKTDHHWNAHAGFLMASEVAKELDSTFGLPADFGFLDRNRFTMVQFLHSFSGSMGDRLGRNYKDDMVVYYPEGDTEFRIEIPSVGMDRTGTFCETLLDVSMLTSEVSGYGAFFRGDYPLVRVENKMSCNNIRMLMLKQSKGIVVCPYLACTVRYLDVIDPRTFDGSIRSFIEQTSPDIVITCVDPLGPEEAEYWKLK